MPIDTNFDITICFKYDDIYFPYVIRWYSTTQHKYFTQVFIDSISAENFMHLLIQRGKHVVYYSWSTSQLQYLLTFSN